MCYLNYTKKCPLQDGKVQICSKESPFPTLSSTAEVFPECSPHTPRDRKGKEGSGSSCAVLSAPCLSLTGH